MPGHGEPALGVVLPAAATGFAVALHQTADLASTAQRKLKMTRLLESALAEAMSYPVLEEGTTSVAVDEMCSVFTASRLRREQQVARHGRLITALLAD